jgi:ribonuclease HI
MRIKKALRERFEALLLDPNHDPISLLRRLADTRAASSTGSAAGPTPAAQAEADAARRTADLLEAMRAELASGAPAAPPAAAASRAEKTPTAAMKEPAFPPPATTPLWESGDEIRSAKVYVDGCSKGNPGPSAGGIVIVSPTDAPIHEAGVFFGDLTNNEAEYRTLIAALETLAGRGVQNVFVFSDSELMVKQLTGVYRIKKPELAALAARAQQQRRAFHQCRFTAVPREKNKRADALANWAIQEEGVGGA